jgi:hypothetical protein
VTGFGHDAGGTLRNGDQAILNLFELLLKHDPHRDLLIISDLRKQFQCSVNSG